MEWAEEEKKRNKLQLIINAEKRKREKSRKSIQSYEHTHKKKHDTISTFKCKKNYVFRCAFNAKFIHSNSMRMFVCVWNMKKVSKLRKK